MVCNRRIGMLVCIPRNELGGDARVCRKFVASDGSGLIESTAELGAWSGSLHIVR